MADDKTTKMLWQLITDTRPNKETLPKPKKAPIPPELDAKILDKVKEPKECRKDQKVER